MQFTKISLIFVTLLTAFSAQASDRLYRWVDENGKVFYSDVIPPAEVDHERATLNKEGVVLDVVGAEKTAEEVQINERLIKLREQQQRLINQQNARDQVLLRTFANEQDLIVARDSKLSAIDIIIQVTHGNTARLKEQLFKLQSIAAQHERAGRPVPEKLQLEIDSSNQQINENETFIQTKEEEKNRIRARFDADRKRFHELKEQQLSDLPKRADNNAPQTGLSLFKCQNQIECATAWKAAEDYVRAQGSTRIILVTNSVIMTSEPVDDHTYGITVSLTESTDGDGEIFLDVQCRNTLKGIELCESQGTQQVRRGFSPALRAATQSSQ